jgi:hypothetical protein
MLLVSLFGIACYVLRSLGVYTIAKRRGIKRSWFAWVPVLDQYLLGCVSDQSQHVVKGKNRNKRTLLLWLNILSCVLSVVFVMSWLFGIGMAASGLAAEVLEEDILKFLIAPVVMTLPMLALSIVTVVFRYIALYDLYTSCSPQNNVMFLSLSIIFKVTEPFFIFFNRKKDDGMPPRKADIIPEPVAEISAPEIDPWDRPDNV